MLKKESKVLLSVAVLMVLLVSMVLAAILYSLTLPSHWGVQTAYGLELHQEGSKITSIEFGLIPRYGSKALDLSLFNIGNSVANVTISLPTNTTEYSFATDFIDMTTIPRFESYNFTISLTDLEMDPASDYSGSFVFSIEG